MCCEQPFIVDVITGMFPILLWIGLIGLVVGRARKWSRWSIAACAIVGLVGVAGMLWASAAFPAA